MSAPKFTFANFLKKYPNDDVCLHEIFKRKYKNTKACSEKAGNIALHNDQRNQIVSIGSNIYGGGYLSIANKNESRTVHLSENLLGWGTVNVFDGEGNRTANIYD